MQATLQYKRWKGPSVSFHTHLISTHFSCFITETLRLLQFYIPVPLNFLIFTSESLFCTSFFSLSLWAKRGMEASISAAAVPPLGSFRRTGAGAGAGCVLFFTPLPTRRSPVLRRRRPSTLCLFVGEDSAKTTTTSAIERKEKDEKEIIITLNESQIRAKERTERKQLERRTYLVAAVMSSFGFTSMAVAAVYYRFAWQMEGNEIPLSEMLGTFSLSVGAAVGMEYWARWAHRALWHASLWHMHESHHRPRDGPFELNDVFAIINAIPAISLLSFGFFNRGLVPGLCFGAGLGITLFGMAYMFVHDGLVHRRFPVGPIANVPYFRRVAAAHKIHHSDKFNGVPYGLFLGPKELEEVGGMEELEKEINRRTKAYDAVDKTSGNTS